MRKRCKRRVTEVKIPLTRGLLDEFAKELHFGLMAAENGHLGKINFDRIGSTLNVLWAAFQHNPPKDASAVPVLEGAMRAMNECGNRCAPTSNWQFTATEILAVSAGIRRAEEAMQYLTVNDLNHGRIQTEMMAKLSKEGR